jgi:hypothetical protein
VGVVDVNGEILNDLDQSLTDIDAGYMTSFGPGDPIVGNYLRRRLIRQFKSQGNFPDDL